MRPICVTCKREMVCEKNEVLVRDKAVRDFPSTYWYGDLYECPDCGTQIITGFGAKMEEAKMGEHEEDALEFEH